MPQPIFALVDCNNFFVSCERVFQPNLEKRPVMVLSSNDGCVVARSQEVKDLGIRMGQPAFQVRDLILEHDIRVFSSNFNLYSDMSHRIMSILSNESPQVEIYSVDEAFLDFSGFELSELAAQGHKMRDQVRQWTGIPISVGFGPTKTLAKIANHVAKKNPKIHGVFDLMMYPDPDQVLNSISVEDIWGVGRRYSKMLRSFGIFTAYDLKQTPLSWVRKKMSITGVRLVTELQGTPCLSVEEVPPLKKTTTVSRTFGQSIETLEELKQAVATFASAAAEKIRRSSLHAGAMSVFVHTSRFDQTSYYGDSRMVSFSQATNDTLTILKYGNDLVCQLYRPGFRYTKAGICLLDLCGSQQVQRNLFAPRIFRNQHLNRAMDDINRTMGRGTLSYGATGLDPRWLTKATKKSQRYTTRWDELAEVK